MDATLVVPPTYLVEMTGVFAIKITARKLHQVDSKLKTIKSCARHITDEVDVLSFLDLVEMIDVRHHLAEHRAHNPV